MAQAEALNLSPADEANTKLEEERTSLRRALAKRLSDVICMPSSQLTPQERYMAGDVLVELLRHADLSLRKSCAKRIVMLNEAPRSIIMILARDDIEVAAPVLEESKSLTDSDLIQIARKATIDHRLMIARRRKVSDAVCDVLVEFLEPAVINVLLDNKGANFSETAVQRMLAASRVEKSFIPRMLKREELRPSHGLTMFWWADKNERRAILKRFAVSRSTLQEACGDLFPRIAGINWQDAPVRKSMQFVERRQRNRAAVERSPFDSLEAAVLTAEANGLSRELAEEISYMAGVKPATGAQIMMDKSGEALAILCKAPGLKRQYLIKLWKALKRPMGTPEQPDPVLQNVLATFDEISTDKAQTVLRYWNWSLTSALSSEIMTMIRKGVIPDETQYGAAATTAALVFSYKNTR